MGPFLGTRCRPFDRLTTEQATAALARRVNCYALSALPRLSCRMETLSAPRCGLNLIWSKLVKTLFFFGYNQISYFRGNHWDTFYNYPKLGGHTQELKDMWEGMKQDSAYKSVSRPDVLLGAL